MGPEVFPMSLSSHSPATTDQHQLPSVSAEEKEVTGSTEMTEVSPFLLQPSRVSGGCILAEMGRLCSALHRRENMVALRTNWLL